MTSMQATALTNIARLIAEDDALPPIDVSIGPNGHVWLSSHYTEGLTRLTLVQAEEARDAWTLALGLNAEGSRDDDGSGELLRYFRASGTWCGARVYLTAVAELAPTEAGAR